MAISLKTKLAVINAVEALIESNTDVRLKLPGVLWQGWDKAPLYAAIGTGDIADEWSYVYGHVTGWAQVEQNDLAIFDQGAGATLFRPLPASVEELQALRDQLADVVSEKAQVDAEYKVLEQTFRQANDTLIQSREAISELMKLVEADTRNAAIRLYTVNGDPEKKSLTEGVKAEFYTATAPYEVTDAVKWAIQNAPWLLTIDAALSDSFALAQANQKPLKAAMEALGCPIKPEQRVRVEIGWKELSKIAEFRQNLSAALSDGDTQSHE